MSQNMVCSPKNTEISMNTSKLILKYQKKINYNAEPTLSRIKSGN